METNLQKAPFPVTDVRRFLEPGPIDLITSKRKEQTNIMTMAWQTVLEFGPSLVGLMISKGSHTHQMLKESQECVINIPSVDLIDKVIGIGTSSGRYVDKIEKFGLTAENSEQVSAPSIKECFANFECRLYDDAMVERYSFFIMEVVSARIVSQPRFPKTLHYRGDGTFMVSGHHLFYPKVLKGR